MTDRKTRARRLEATGYTFVSGWLPEQYGQNLYVSDLQNVIRFYEPSVEQAASTPMTQGRPARAAPAIPQPALSDEPG